MIAFSRSAVIAPGKTASALAYARELAKTVHSKTGVDVQIAVPIGGNPSRVCFLAQYENLGALEKAQGQLMSDTGYLDVVAKGGDNFVAGSLQDEIWRVL
jgi:hypothetical protein